MNWDDIYSPHPGCWVPYIYSLSDSSLATSFFIFFVTKCSSLPSRLDKHLKSTTKCMYKHTFCINISKCWFCSFSRSHCKICQLPTIQTHKICIVANGQILQWDLMCKINILRSRDKKYVYIHTHTSALKRFARFGWQSRMFCRKKRGKSGCQTRVRQTIVSGSDLNSFARCPNT